MSRSRINPISRESRHVSDAASEQGDASLGDGVNHEGSLEEQYRGVRDSTPREADVVELEREARESVDEKLPHKRKFDPVFGYFTDRMGIDPHDVAFYYELAVRPKDGGESAEPFRQHFTNLHDLQEAMRQKKEQGVSTVALHLPQDFLTRLQPGGDLQKFNDGFSIVRGQLEKDTLKITDKYAEVAENGELARLRKEDTEKRGSETDQQQAVVEELVRQDVAEQIKSVASKKEISPEQRERELRSELNMARGVYVGSELNMRTWEKKNKWFWDRRKLERAVKRAHLASILAPGDSKVPTRAGVSIDALHDVADRENTFRDRLREQGITKEADIRQIYSLEQHKVEYEHARAALGMHLKKTETERFAGDDSGAEHAQEFARAKVYDELFVQESLKLNKMKIAEWPEAERSWARRKWESWREWNAKLKPWQRVGIGLGVAAGGAGIAAASGVVGASVAAAYAGRRAVGAVAGVLGGFGGKELAERLISKSTQAEIDRLDARESVLKEKMRGLETIDADAAARSLVELSQEYQHIMDARYGVAKRRAMWKAAGTVVGGLALGAGTSYAAAHLGSIDTFMPTKPTAEHIPTGQKSSLGAVHESTPAPKPMVHETPEIRPTPEAALGRSHESLPIHAEQHPIGAQLEELATLKKGEGAWGPVRRQLRAQLTTHPEEFGLKPEDLQNGAKVQHALNSRTTQILKDLGFIGPKGKTLMGIHPPGTKIILESNGGLRIEGGHAYDYAAHHRASETTGIVGETRDASRSVESVSPVAHETVIHHEPVPVEPLRAVPAPPIEESVPVVAPETPVQPEPTPLTKAADVLQAPESKPAAVTEVIPTPQDTATLHAAVMKEVTEHFAEDFNKLSPFGQECFLYSLEHQAASRRGAASIGDILADPMMFRMDMNIAKAVGAITPDELSTLHSLGFTKESLFTVDHGDYSYAVSLRHMSVGDYLKTLGAEHGAADTKKLGTWVNFVVGGQGRGQNSAVVLGNRHIALAKKLAEYIERGGKPELTVGEALVTP